MVEAKQNEIVHRGTPCWRCDSCNKNFQTKGLVEQHIRRVHK